VDVVRRLGNHLASHYNLGFLQWDFSSEVVLWGAFALMAACVLVLVFVKPYPRRREDGAGRRAA
jgi:hypothetical protein